jgi:hypothetical protein
MLLHFGHTLPDRLIGYRQKDPFKDCQSISLLRRDLLLQSLAVPEQQGESIQVPCTGLTP